MGPGKIMAEKYWQWDDLYNLSGMWSDLICSDYVAEASTQDRTILVVLQNVDCTSGVQVMIKNRK